MRDLSVGLLVATLATGLLAPIGPTYADEAAELVLEVVPPLVSIVPGHDVTVLVVARNGGGVARELQIAASATAGAIGLTPPSWTVAELPAGGEMAWTLMLTAAPDTSADTTVTLRARYISEGPNGPVPRIALGTLLVTTAIARSAADVLAVQIAAPDITVNEYRSSTIRVVMRNRLDQPVHVGRVRLQAPAFLDVDLVEPPDATDSSGSSPDVLLAPRASRFVTVTIGASDAVQPGRHVLIADVPVAWRDDDRMHTAMVAATHTLTVGVFGESEMLASLAIPTVLFLPGFLLLVTLNFVLRVGKRTDGADSQPLQLTLREFATLSILTSGIMAVLYPRFTHLGGSARNYLRGYGVKDLVWLWGLSIGSGIVLAIVGRFAPRLWHDYRASRARAEQLQPDDDPLTVLTKLGQAGRTIDRKKASWQQSSGGDTLPVLLLEDWTPSRDEHWVCPGIQYRWLEAATDAQRQPVDRLILKRTALTTLAGALRAALADGILEIAWNTRSRLSAITRVKTVELTAIPQREYLVREAE